MASTRGHDNELNLLEATVEESEREPRLWQTATKAPDRAMVEHSANGMSKDLVKHGPCGMPAHTRT
eukprot:1312477-Alexandrium_andersonii.AAC.1